MSTPLLSILHAHATPINVSDHEPTLDLVTPDLSNHYLTPRLNLTHAPTLGDAVQTTRRHHTHDALIGSGARPPLQQTIKHYHDSSPLATSPST